MSLPQCPTCAGEGFITLEGTHPLSYYIGLGWLHVAFSRSEGRNVLLPTKKFHQDAQGLPDPAASFKECWCNHEILHTSFRIGEPLYWRNDRSGFSGKAVFKLFPALEKSQVHPDEPLTEGEVWFLKAYIAQWVIQVQKNAARHHTGHVMVPTEHWLPRLAQAQTKEDFISLDELLEEFGLSPF